MSISQADLKLLNHLQADARLTHAQLAEKVGLSQSACHRRVKQLEADGVIERYGAVVDRKKVDLNILAYMFVKLESHAEELLKSFADAVDQIEEVVACYAISGGGDYLLMITAKDMDAYADVALKRLAKLPGVKDSSSSFVLSTMKLAPGWPLSA